MTRQPNAYYESFVVTLANGQKGIYVSDGTTSTFLTTASSRSATAGAVPALNKYLLARTRALVQLDTRQKHGNTGSYAEADNTERDLKDTELFLQYLQRGKVYNLTSILEKADPQGKIFYIPSDCYYIGDEDIPTYSVERAAAAVNAYNQEAAQNQNNAFLTLPSASAEEDKTQWIWLLLPVAAFLITRYMKTNNKTKRKR